MMPFIKVIKVASVGGKSDLLFPIIMRFQMSKESNITVADFRARP
jgi:hypothetical protein